MAVVENADVKVDSSDHDSDKNTDSLKDTILPCPDDQKPKSDTSVEIPNPTNQSTQRTSDEVNFKSHLNPMAKEYVPSPLALNHSEFLRNRLCFANYFPMQVISIEETGHFATRRMNFDQGRRWIKKRTNFSQTRRTVYVSDIDQQV
ncbi:PREDICTED: polyadenylate-binding protein-interacting protein 13-like [Camelina sativa]|uniref:Polyadenylate-binding protein-interacting protein 13-like n=1 Tax=Camelina sativa TaxID=90675 RepID=A0ABM0Y0F9_CAMSA|nr:PREDICTED: polyadenylate-binding protein-interacting protein 13-like [Camelina sativa]